MRRQLQTSVALMLAGSAFVVAAQTSASSPSPAQGQAPAPTPVAAGAAVPIESKVAMCIGCHGIPGYQATFPEVYKVPMIAGQNSKYLSSALTAYAKGERKHPTMRGIAQSLTEKDITDISAYYEQQAKVPAVPETVAPPAEIKALLDKGACASCHGANFSKPIDGTYPKIAGQHADYLYAALKAYQTEGNPYVGRGNAIMAAQVKQFSHAELKALGKYLASLPGELRTVPQSKLR
ncbi:c-type cytochrome [Roseateles sp. SL47]|jgi:cytochrome c553|uniref:c-type cytochrome n=1 Tax=Roseateles sp. SL47 TaxID=2995138 RepID=UPI00226DA9DE|nr:c-type cytochrome [Roseateles sp. SL47]WAC75229.1 c-type cytochrome [Roseateles sp. SL47]